MSTNSNKKDPDGSYYHNNDDDELINNYYSDLLNQPAFFSSTTTNNDGPANNNEPDYGREAFSTTSTLTSINDYDITGGSGGDYNYTTSNYDQGGEGRRILRYANTGDTNGSPDNDVIDESARETNTDGTNTNTSHESPTTNNTTTNTSNSHSSPEPSRTTTTPNNNTNTSNGSLSGGNNIIGNNKGETYGWEEISVDYGQHQQLSPGNNSDGQFPSDDSDESKEVGIIQSVLNILGLSSAINNKRKDLRTEVVQEAEDIEKGTLVQDPTTTRGSKPTTSEGSDSSGLVRGHPLFIFNKKKKKEENKQQQQQRRQSSRRRHGEHQEEGINDEYHWNEVNISNTDSDNTSSTTKRKKLAAFFTRCCHIPTLIILLLLLLGSVATVISIIILRRGGERSGDGGIKLDGGLNDFPTSSPTNTKLVNACVCYPINNTTATTNNNTINNNTTNDNNAPSSTINSGVYTIGGINYQCLNDDSTIVPEYLTICIYPTFNIFSDKYNMDGYNYGKTNDEQVINVDGDVTISTFGELTAVQPPVSNINTEINVAGVTSFGTLNVNNLDMSLLLLNTDNLLLEEEIMNYYEDAIKMGKFY